MHICANNFYLKLVRVIDSQCFENMQDTIHSEAGLGIEYDEDVICDVCRSVSHYSSYFSLPSLILRI